jgi:glycogen debranching enzyme
MDARRALDTLRSPEGWLRASSEDGRFGSLFGRDALISALQVLTVDPAVADATLTRLGAELGQRNDRETEEEPGKVLHEARDHALDAYVAHGWPVRGGRLRYWGSVDASPWFLIVLGALARSGHDVRAHLDAGRRIADRLAAAPMPVAYRRRATHGGLAHYGWRDVAADLEGNGHGVVDERGRPLQPPVALAQVHALTWRALHEAAHVVDRGFAPAAEQTHASFVHAFVDVDRDRVAFARHHRGLDWSVTSDLGQVLWTGVLDGHRAAHAVRRRIDEPDLTTPYGLRSVATTHAAFRPDGYHTGAVWPFDTWLGSPALWPGVVEACGQLDGFPELYVVGRDNELRAHPEACRTQAWTVGAVIAIEAGWDGRAWLTE